MDLCLGMLVLWYGVDEEGEQNGEYKLMQVLAVGNYPDPGAGAVDPSRFLSNTARIVLCKIEDENAFKRARDDLGYKISDDAECTNMEVDACSSVSETDGGIWKQAFAKVVSDCLCPGGKNYQEDGCPHIEAFTADNGIDLFDLDVITKITKDTLEVTKRTSGETYVLSLAHVSFER